MTAWEITSDDVEIVLRAHGLEFSDDRIQAICDELDHDEIIDRLLNLTDFDQQCNSALDDIEDTLLKQGVITGEKKFRSG